MKKLYITVLSKNRSLQFQSLIDSLFLNIKKYYPLTIKVLYNDKDDDHFFNPNAYRKLKSSYEHIEFKNVDFDNTFNIHEYFIKDELNLFLTDNVLFTLPLDLYEIGSIDFDNSVLDLFKGINRQKNTNNTYRYDAHKWKQDNKLYYIENNDEAFETTPLIHPCIGKIFLANDKDVNIQKTYFFPLAPCFINSINSESGVDNYSTDDIIEYGTYALCTRYLMGERIDVSKSQGYSPNTILDEYRYEFTDILTKNPSFDYFKNIVYLNLEERTDRKKEIESELAKFNINAQHFNAFKVDLDEALKCMGNRTDLDEHSLKLAPSRVGASKSHIGAVQLAKDNNWDNVLILEDDVKFVDNAPYILEQALLELKDLPRWDVLYLGANSMDTIKQISGHVGELTAAFCNHAYVVNKHFYDTILNYNWNQYLITDQFYLDICRDTRYTTYTVLPIIATQKSSFSDIEGKEVNYEDVIKDSYKNTLNIFK